MSQTKAQLIDTLVASLLPASDSAVDIGSNAVRFANIYGDTLYGNGANLTGINTDLVSDTSPQLGGNLDVNTKNILFGDSASASDDRLIFGAGTDLSIYHDGTDSIIQGGDPTVIRSHLLLLKNFDNSESYIRCYNNGAVELYHDNSKKFETFTDGLSVSTQVQFKSTFGSNPQEFDVRLDTDGRLVFDRNGDASTPCLILDDDNDGQILIPNDNQKLRIGAGQDLEIYHSGSHSHIRDVGTGILSLSGNQLNIQNAVINENMAEFFENAAVNLYYDNSKKFETTSVGAKVTGRLGVDKGPTTKLNAELSVFAATGNDDASDWGADGIFQLDHTGTSAVNNEVLMLGAVSGGVGQIASGFGFGRESTSNWGTYISFKTHSTSTSNIDELIERWRITSAGHFENNSDSIRIKLGASDDLQIYHDGSNSHIEEGGTGGLLIKGDSVNIGATSGEFYFRGFENGSSLLRYDNSTKLETTSSGISVTGAVEPTGHVKLDDDRFIYFGDGDDFIIGHQPGTPQNVFRSTDGATKMIFQGGSETMVVAHPQAQVELYYDNDKKFATKSDGVRATGRVEAFPSSSSPTIAGQFYNNSTGASADCIVIIKTYANQGADPYIKFDAGGSDMIVGNKYGGTTNNKLVLGAGTSISGGVAGLQIDGGGQITPDTDNARDLGSTSLRFRNIFTHDLNLSNEGGANDVDGTWGSYTIQEGEESLFLINKRNGKKYKFALTEVS